MRDKDEALAIVDAAQGTFYAVGCFRSDGQWRELRHAVVGLRRLFADLTGFRASLQQIAAIVLCFGAFDVEQRTLRRLVELPENLLKLQRRDQIDAGAAAGV